MKTILFLSLIFLVSCVDPTKIGHQDDPSAPSDPGTTGGPDLPVYVPPAMDGAKETIVLRAPHGYAISASRSRGVIALSDPIIGACNEPGSVYMFYSEGALVQYKPEDGNYTAFSLTAKITVELHNSTNPESDWWDFVSVSQLGFVHDLSHDPPHTVRTIRFLTNAGTLAEHPNVPGYVFDNTFSLEDYHTFVNLDGSPKQIIRGDFEGWGASDGHTVIHMQLGGDGASIPPMTYHF